MISFGLVNIPVELHAAVSDNRPHFRLLHARDKSPVSYDRVCQREGKPVAWTDLVKGYEYAKGKYVVLTKDDFQTAALEKTKTIDILHFVPGDQIDDRFFDTSYFAVPGKGGGRGYAVLREALQETGQVGIGKVVLRETQHLAALNVVDRALVLTLMRFADQLVDVDRFTFPSAKDVRKPELAMAKQLIESLAGDWKPEQYKDDYQVNLMRIVKAKLKGTKPDLVEEQHGPDTQVVDLMERLKRSLAGRKSTGKRPSARRSKARSAAA